MLHLLDSLPTCILVHRDGNVLHANSAACALLGYALDELVGLDVAKIFVPSERATWRPPSNKSQPAPRRLAHKDGNVIPIDVTPFEIAFEGEPAGAMWIQDQRAQKAMQRQLVFTERMASVGALAAGVAHEINNPLTYVLANTETLELELEEMDETKQRTLFAELIAEIREGAERVQGTVRDLLVFSHHDEEDGPVDVRAVLESSISMAANQIRHRGRLVTRIAPVAPVYGNQRRLGQVFLNLLVNASQALPAPPNPDNEIEITLREVGDRVVVRVADTGTGIPADVKERIFEPFFTTKPAGVGTGLGLSICYSIVRTLGGTIEAHDREAGGTEFVVALPLLEKQTRPSPRTTPPTPPGRILVVDDDPLILRTVSRSLKRHRVDTLSDSVEALQRLSEETYDVVLCDVVMPNLTGIDVFHRACEKDPEIAERFVFMSGGVFTDATHDFFQRSERPLLTKPFRREELTGLIHRTLTRLGPASQPQR